MSLTSALNAARAGLTSTSRWAQTTSTNIANANTAGYAKRSPLLTTSGLGEPMVRGIARSVDASLDRLYRTENARTGHQSSLANALSLHAATLGGTDAADGMLTRLSDFRSAMGLLSVSPSDSALQRAAVSDAEGLAAAINRTHDGLAAATRTAQNGVSSDISQINETLSKIARLNDRIVRTDGTDDRSLSFADQLTEQLDTLSNFMDFTLQYDDTGRVQIYASGGAVILDDDEPQVISFDAATGTLLAGTTDITPGDTGARGISTGSLVGHIEFLNDTAPGMQKQLDEVARALIEGFQAADASLAPGDAGLFTDAGSALTGAYTPGLAGRIAVNDAVRPEAGGELWRIRDGMGATTQGPVGDPTQINAFAELLDGSMSFDPSAGLGDGVTLSSYISTLIASQQYARAEAETARDTAFAGAETIQAKRMSFMGVNIDDELQQLVQIEQSYAANSKLLQTVGEMVDTLLNAF
ncbi:MAG: flagellar hook-associated protein FlgK [Pseudooceanicola sp.]